MPVLVTSVRCKSAALAALVHREHSEYAVLQRDSHELGKCRVLGGPALAIRKAELLRSAQGRFS
jgi:hypothetical protein